MAFLGAFIGVIVFIILAVVLGALLLTAVVAYILQPLFNVLGPILTVLMWGVLAAVAVWVASRVFFAGRWMWRRWPRPNAEDSIAVHDSDQHAGWAGERR